MRQQINLYQDILIDKPEPFQSRQVGLFLILLVIGLAIVGFLSYRNAQSIQVKAAQLRQQEQAFRQQVSELEEKYPPRKANQLLVQKVARLELEVAGQRNALDYFTHQGRGNNAAIIASLEGLARNPQKGLWLRRIAFTNGGTDVQLTGSALQPERVPEYLKLLGEKNIFGGQVFARLVLNRLEDNGAVIGFELDSSGGTQ